MTAKGLRLRVLRENLKKKEILKSRNVVKSYRFK